MAQDFWRRLMSIRNTRVPGVKTNAGPASKPVGDELGNVRSSINGSGPQSFFPSGKAATTGVSKMTIVDVIESDILVTDGPALVTFINASIAAKGDPFKEIAALSQLRGDVLGSAPNLEGTLITQLGTVILTKIQAAITKAQANLAAPAA